MKCILATDFIKLSTNIHLGLIRDINKARLAVAALSRHVLSQQCLFPVVTTTGNREQVAWNIQVELGEEK